MESPCSQPGLRNTTEHFVVWHQVDLTKLCLPGLLDATSRQQDERRRQLSPALHVVSLDHRSAERIRFRSFKLES
jgi:hypothetical protein